MGEGKGLRQDKKSLRQDVGTIVGVGAAVTGASRFDVRDGTYPAWVIVADSAQYPASRQRYEEDAAMLYHFFLTKVPWETWDEFERLSLNRRGANHE